MTPDSSVVIAAFASWNRHHEAAIEALVENDVRGLLAHAELESYSVLTRLPEPFRAEPALVAEYLHMDYPGRRMVLPERERRRFVKRLASLSIAGGAVYDAIAPPPPHTTARACSAVTRAPPPSTAGWT